MIKVYDKAQWHIDAGENKDIVILKLEEVFSFLEDKELLTDEGKEIVEMGIDSSVSIHERMLISEGNNFLDKYYDEVINLGPGEILEGLKEKYMEFKQ